MANVNNPTGGKISDTLVSAKYSDKIYEFIIPSTDASYLYVGDFVKFTGNSSLSGIPYISKCTATDVIGGIVMSIKNIYTHEQYIMRHPNELLSVSVCIDPMIIIEMQVNGTLTTAQVGKYVDLTVANGDETVGVSHTQIDLSTANDNQGQLLILGLIQREGNTVGEYAKVRCKIVRHQLSGASEDLWDRDAATSTITPKTAGDNLHIVGKLTVDGLIDPTALILSPQTSVPATTDGTVYYNDDTGKFQFREDGAWHSLAGDIWLPAVISELNLVTSEPAAPVEGDRYINTATGDSSETTQAVVANYIYEWNGVDWTSTAPVEGMTAWNQTTNSTELYNGTAWVTTGASLVTSPNATSLVGGTTLAHALTGAHNTIYGQQGANSITSGYSLTAVGSQALKANTTGYKNTAVGISALTKNISGIHNVAIGAEALSNNTVGFENTAVGEGSLTNCTASGITAIGEDSGSSHTTGLRNSYLGYSAGSSMSTASDSTLVGSSAGATATGSSLTAVGSSALAATTGSNSTAVGYYAGIANLAGVITAVGSNALKANTTGINNTAVGQDTLITSTTSSNNTAVGFEALRADTSGNHNTGIGAQALKGTSIGLYNTAVGSTALITNTSGSSNVGIGFRALQFVNTSNNTAVGKDALLVNTSGANNTAIGYVALSGNITGSNSTVIGSSAAVSATAAEVTAVGSSAVAAVTTGTPVTAIGYAAGSDAVAQTNVTFLGHGTTIGTFGNNTCVVGNSTQTVRSRAIGGINSILAADTDLDTDEVLSTGLTATYGLLIVRESTGGTSAVFRVENQTLVDVSINALFTHTKDNAATYNVYWEADQFKVQNKVGDDKNIRVGFFGVN